MGRLPADPTGDDDRRQACRTEASASRCALEPEFYLLLHRDENSGRVRSRQLLPDVQSGWLGQAEQVFVDASSTSWRAMGVAGCRSSARNTGPGQYEMSVQSWRRRSKRSIDYFSLKDAVRRSPPSTAMSPRFMPKPLCRLGRISLHVHLSLWDAAGERDLTASDQDEISLSNVGSGFWAGCSTHATALDRCSARRRSTAISGCNPAPGHRPTPTGATATARAWSGFPGVGTRRHLEFRSPDNTAQPYLLLTRRCSRAGLDGIRRQLDPRPAVPRRCRPS